jgi:hypothetical protein
MNPDPSADETPILSLFGKGPLELGKPVERNAAK